MVKAAFLYAADWCKQNPTKFFIGLAIVSAFVAGAVIF